MTNTMQPAKKPIADPLDVEVQFLKGVGPYRAKLLTKLDIANARDLLWFAPRDYEDLRNFTPIRSMSPGEQNQIRGRLEFVKARESRAQVPMIEATFSDKSGFVSVVWFNRPFVAEKFRLEREYRIIGKAELRDGRWKMSNPSIYEIDDIDSPELPTTLQPIYPLTEGLHQATMRRVMQSALQQLANLAPEIIPDGIRRGLKMGSLEKALWNFHFPTDRAAATRARNRLVFEELFCLQVGLAVKRSGQKKLTGAPIKTNRKVDEHIRRLFPYKLTVAQNRAVIDIVRDLAKPEPMYRLIQGDVGCGKTAVAGYAILSTIANGFQTALLAPTEVLARQHFRTFDELLSKSKVRRLLFTGGLPAKVRAERLRWLAEGDYDLVVGTHALLEPTVRFKNLGLVVVDEQHKFGVRQRAELQRFLPIPHQLVMTATPIPRSLAMTWFGDLDLSIIDAKPPGRLDTLTYLVAETERPRAYEFLQKQLAAKMQALIVCPRIDQTDELGVRSVTEIRAELAQRGIPDAIVGIVHGKLDESAKDAVVRRFREGTLRILVATVVVEVGLDVPAANVLIVENAERFGLSQLHQIRGRVGRSTQRGICFLVNRSADPKTRERLRLFSQTTDGFQIAEWDARFRGTGEVIGTRQHGSANFVIADLQKDLKILELARREAQRLVESHPSLDTADLQALRKTVLTKYGKLLDLAHVG